MKDQYIHINQDGDKRTYEDRDFTVLHSDTGPAIERADGTKEYWVKNVQFPKEKFDKRQVLIDSGPGEEVEIGGARYKLVPVEVKPEPTDEEIDKVVIEPVVEEIA